VAKDILIVEPDRRTADTLVLRLTARGYSARSAATPAEAEDALLRRRPDLMIVGLSLPNGSPKSLCDRLRAMPGGALAPILLVEDGAAEITTQRDAIALGADRVFRWPADLPTLIETAASLLGPSNAQPPIGPDGSGEDSPDESLDFSSVNALIWSDAPGDLTEGQWSPDPRSMPPRSMPPRTAAPEDSTELSLDDSVSLPAFADFDGPPATPTDLPSIDFESLSGQSFGAPESAIASVDFSSLNETLRARDEGIPPAEVASAGPPSLPPEDRSGFDWGEAPRSAVPQSGAPPPSSIDSSWRREGDTRASVTASARAVPDQPPVTRTGVTSPGVQPDAVTANAPMHPRARPTVRFAPTLPRPAAPQLNERPPPLPKRPSAAYRPPAPPTPPEDARWQAVVQPGRAIPLARRGLGGLLIGMARLHLSGRVEVAAGGALRRVFFDAGRPVFFDSSAAEEDLGAWLAREGQVTRGVLASARTQAAQLGVPPEELLIEQGSVTSETVYRALAAHITERIIALFGLESGTSLVIQGGPRPVDPADLGAPIERLVLDGVRRKYGRLRLYRAFGTPVTVPRPAAARPRVPLRVDEQAALDAVDGRRTVAEIAQAIRMADPDALAVLHGLALAGFIEPPAVAGQGTLPPLDAALIARAEGPQSADQRPGFADQVHAKLADVHEADYFAVLDVPPEATGAEIEAAYMTLRRRFDPHGVAGPLAEQVRDIADVLGDAFAILSDPRRRRCYAEALTRRRTPEAQWRYSKS
jgi:CheY-like chemotaxis protein